jgi:uncharacterized membrane protein (UPF0136 family)
MALLKKSQTIVECALILATFLSGIHYCVSHDLVIMRSCWWIYTIIVLILLLLGSMKKGNLNKYIGLLLIVIASAFTWYFIKEQAVIKNEKTLVLFFGAIISFIPFIVGLWMYWKSVFRNAFTYTQ